MVELKHSIYDDDDEYIAQNTAAVVETRQEGACADTVPSPQQDERSSSDNAAQALNRRGSRSDNGRPLEDVPTQGREQRRQTNPVDHDRMVASGTAAAILGFFLGGPILAAIFGFLSSYATGKQDAAGDMARALGDIAILAKAKASELDQKYHIVEAAKRQGQIIWAQAKVWDHHDILSKVETIVENGIRIVFAFSRNHRLIERGIALAGRFYEYVAHHYFTGTRVGGISTTTRNR